MFIIETADFSGIPNRAVSYRTKEAFQLADEQEQFAKKILTKSYPIYNYYTEGEFFNGLRPDENRLLGDIICVKKNEQIPSLFIDLKVAYYNSANNFYLGTITLKSLLAFTKHDNHAYLCLNKDGSVHRLIMAQEIKNLLDTTKCLYAANPNGNSVRRIVAPELQYLLPQYIKNDYGNVSYSDYIPSFVYLKHLKLN